MRGRCASCATRLLLAKVACCVDRAQRRMRRLRDREPKEKDEMKGSRCALVLAIVGGGVGLLACEAPSSDRLGEETASRRSALTTSTTDSMDADDSSPPSSSDLPSLTLRWALGSGVQAQDPSSPANLSLESHDEEPLDAHVTL